MPTGETTATGRKRFFQSAAQNTSVPDKRAKLKDDDEKARYFKTLKSITGVEEVAFSNEFDVQKLSRVVDKHDTILNEVQSRFSTFVRYLTACRTDKDRQKTARFLDSIIE